jgi:FO synthase
MKMLREAGELRIPFTTGILLGIGETRRERVESLLAIRDLHREYGHIQEVIVQNFRAQPGVPMEHAPEPDDVEVAHSIAMARLILDPDVGVQAPPNLNPASAALLLKAGINDFGGISPVSPDYINRGHPWPHIEALSTACAAEGFTLKPRLAVYPAYVERHEWIEPALGGAIKAAAERVERT